MTTAIFIRTHAPDWKWLSYALISLRKYAKDHSDIIVCAPEADYNKLRHKIPTKGITLSTFVGRPHVDDYIGQQITKLRADHYCPGATNILFWDSDCIATRPFSVNEFTNEAGKLKHTYRRWEDAGTAICWRPITEQVIGKPAPYEFMAQLPIIHKATTLQAFRDYLTVLNNLTGKTEQKTFGVIASGWQQLSEFNALGSFAFTDPNIREQYAWVEANPGDDGYPRPCRQFWSRQPFTPAVEQEINSYLA